MEEVEEAGADNGRDNGEEEEAAAAAEMNEAADGQEEEGYHTFRARQAKGVLYKLASMDGPLKVRLTKYVHGGAMDGDLRFVREVFGLVNTSGRKDFDLFWESPFIEEHVHDTTRKRKLDAQQRSMAVRSYIRASSTTAAEPENIDRFLSTVDRLTEWEDQHGSKDIVKTVSRMVQSFERSALSYLITVLDGPACRSYSSTVRSLVDPAHVYLVGEGEAEGPNAPDITSVACTLRRSRDIFHLFAAVVAADIIWAEATNGARNTTIYMCKQLDEKRRESAMGLIRGLYALRTDLPHDTMGMPLMHINASMCVCRGVLVVMPGSVSATYILDIADGTSDLTNVKHIRITHVLEETPESAAAPASSAFSSANKKGRVAR